VIQRRVKGDTPFFKDWNAYKSGFGSAEHHDSEYWLGWFNIFFIQLMSVIDEF